MRRFTYVSVRVVAAAVLLVPRVAAAQTSDAQAIRQEIDQLKRDFDARLSALEARLAALQGGRPAPAPAPPAAPAAPAAPAPGGAPQTQPTATVPAGAEGAGGPTGSLPVYGSAASGSKVFNPDIAVIGDFLGAAGRNQVSADPAL